MKLNPDCIRDILLTAEEICEFDTPWKHDKEQSIGERLEKYPYDEILYHLHQAGKSGLLENVHIYDDMGAFFVNDVSPSGHEFLANIRSDTIWNSVKAISSKVGSKSLDSITLIASNVITQIIKSQLGLA